MGQIVDQIMRDIIDTDMFSINERAKLSIIISNHLEPQKKAEECEHQYRPNQFGEVLCMWCGKPEPKAVECKHIRWDFMWTAQWKDYFQCKVCWIRKCEPQQEDKKCSNCFNYSPKQ